MKYLARSLLVILLLVIFVVPLRALYTLGPGDVLTIKVFEDPESSGDFEVSPEGYINFPYIGRVKVEGLTPSQVERLLERELKKKHIYVEPHVSVVVKEYRSQKVIVLGEVEKPGIYPITGNVTVLDVISMCGGLTDKAGERLILIRKGAEAYQGGVTSASGKIVYAAERQGKKILMVNLKDLLQKGDLRQNYTVEGGDVIFVPQAGKIYVFGEVKKPGVYKYTQGMTILQAIVKAEGFTVRAAPSRARIIRMIDGKEHVIEVNLKKVIDNKARDVELKDGDVVVIPESYF